MSLFFDYTLDGIANGMIYAASPWRWCSSTERRGSSTSPRARRACSTTFIAFSLLVIGARLLVGLRARLVIGFAIGAVTERLLIRPCTASRTSTPSSSPSGCSSSSRAWPEPLRQRQPRLPGRLLPARARVGTTTIAFSHFDVFILVADWRSWRAPGALPFHGARAPHAGVGLPCEIARLLGVRVGLLLTLGWALAGIAGSLAGLLVAPTSSFGPYYMDLILVYGFTAAVIGGLESPVGALVGGLIAGCISYVGGYLGSGLEPLGALVLLIVALMVRPEGFFARPAARQGVTWTRQRPRPVVCACRVSRLAASSPRSRRWRGVVLYV